MHFHDSLYAQHTTQVCYRYSLSAHAFLSAPESTPALIQADLTEQNGLTKFLHIFFLNGAFSAKPHNVQMVF